MGVMGNQAFLVGRDDHTGIDDVSALMRPLPFALRPGSSIAPIQPHPSMTSVRVATL